MFFYSKAWPEDDLLIEHAIGLIPTTETDALSEETDNTNNANDSATDASANAGKIFLSIYYTAHMYIIIFQIILLELSIQPVNFFLLH